MIAEFIEQVFGAAMRRHAVNADWSPPTPQGATPRQLEILKALAQSGGYLTEDLCERMGAPVIGWATWRLEMEQIERAGLAIRRRRRGRKACRWELTDKGKALAEAARWGYIG